MGANVTLTVAVVVCLLAGPTPANAEPRCRRPAIHIHKGEGELILTCRKKVRLRAKVSFGGSPKGHKVRSGDQKTPEGRYYVCSKKRSKRFHRFLGISYPNPADAGRGLRKRMITKRQHDRIVSANRRRRQPPWNTRLGGAIAIHGVKPHLSLAVQLWNGLSRVAGLYRSVGFSDGCIVTNNGVIRRLFVLVPLGTPVYIHPVGAQAAQKLHSVKRPKKKAF